jgi:hypothetical protein
MGCVTDLILAGQNETKEPRQKLFHRQDAKAPRTAKLKLRI